MITKDKYDLLKSLIDEGSVIVKYNMFFLKKQKYGNNKLKEQITPRPMARFIQYKKKNTYLYIRLQRDNKKYSISVHRAIWFLKNGKIPEGMEINHKNGNKIDNRISNLELMTRKENIKHSKEILKTFPVGEKHGMHKLTEIEVKEIRRILLSGEHTHSNIAKKYKVTRCNISKINIGILWSYLNTVTGL